MMATLEGLNYFEPWHHCKQRHWYLIMSTIFLSLSSYNITTWYCALQDGKHFKKRHMTFQMKDM